MLQPLGLNVGTVAALFVGTFVPVYAQPVQRIIKVLERFVVIPGLIGVFDPQYEFAPHGTGEKIVEQKGSDASQVLQSRGGRSVSYSDTHINNRLILYLR